MKPSFHRRSPDHGEQAVNRRGESSQFVEVSAGKTNGASPLFGERVGRIDQLAALQRQATTADATVQVVAQALKDPDAGIKPVRPAGRDEAPVLRGRRPPCRQRPQSLGDLRERQTDFLCRADEGQTPKDVPTVAALVSIVRSAEIRPLRS